ncbi:MAG: RNA polymerase factor sigma-54 [Cetobacterium sp.]
MLKLELDQKMKIGLSLEMKLSIEILKMGLNELKDFLQKEQIKNPTFEIIYSKSINKKNDNNINYLENISEGEKSLIHYLEEQIIFLNVKKEVRNILNYLINNLDEKGYIDGDLEELRKAGYFKSLYFKEALNILSKLEPLGVGSIDLINCLKIQIKNKGIKDDNLEKIIENNLEDIAYKNFLKISLDRLIEMERVEYYVKLIKTLNPKPASGFFVNRKTKYIIPDLIVEILGKEMSVTLNEDDLPIIKTKKLEMKNSYNTPLFLERCIQRRQNTLFKVGQYILNHQRDNLINNKPLKTLKIKDIAFELNLHDSTISRAIKDKFIKNGKKIEPLRKYIVLDAKNEIIKNEIINLIKNENKKIPLSDEEILNFFIKNKIIINRRTITKYRNELGFFSSQKRKEM